MSKFVFFLFIIGAISLSAQKIQIQVYTGVDINRISIESINGNCQIHSSTGFLTELLRGSQLTLSINSSGKIHVSQDGQFLCLADSVFFIQSEVDDYLNFFSTETGFFKSASD